MSLLKTTKHKVHTNMDTWGEVLGIVIQSQCILGVEVLLSAKVKRLRVGSFSSFNGSAGIFSASRNTHHSALMLGTSCEGWPSADAVNSTRSLVLCVWWLFYLSIMIERLSLVQNNPYRLCKSSYRHQKTLKIVIIHQSNLYELLSTFEWF